MAIFSVFSVHLVPLLSIRINSTYKYELKIVNSTSKNLLNYEKMSSNYEEKWGGGHHKM